MAVGEDTRSNLGFVEPELMVDVTLIEIDSGSDPLLAKVADALFRWRFGIVVLSPVFLAIAAFALMGQQGSPDPTNIETDRPSSALEPLIEGVAGPSSRTGAAPAISGDPTADSSFSTGSDSGAGESTTTGQTASPAGSPDSVSTSVELVAGPTAIPDESPSAPPTTKPVSSSSSTPSTTDQPATTTTHATTTSTALQTTTTESETTTSVTTGLATCTVSITHYEVDLRVSPNDSSEDLLLVPAGIYQVITTVGQSEITWYFIDVSGTQGWVKADEVVDESYICS